MIHDYAEVDLDEVWKAVEGELPELNPIIMQMLEELDG